VRPRIVFLGSPACAVPSLRAAAQVGDVVAALSQPDRPAGRGRKTAPPPVAVAAHAAGIPVHQPERLRPPEVQELLRSCDADVFLVVAYGRILPAAVLALPRRGCLNVHFSLLPRHRGAAPVARAILAGDAATGVTLMVLDQGMDTGPTLDCRRVDIGPEETAGELTERLAAVGAEMVAADLPRYLADGIAPRPQPEEGATLAPPLEKAEGAIRWDRPASEAHRQIRGVTPWPGAYGWLDGKRVIIHRARVLPHVESPGPGAVRVQGRRVAVGASDVCLELLELQREGGKRLDVSCFLAGCGPLDGCVIRPEPPARG
jgi:methionyl-tRNA formyltransferase